MDLKKKHAIDIIKTLRSHGHQAFLCGGCVRDMVMRRAPVDYDLATDATPGMIQGIFKKTVPVGAAFGTLLVISSGIAYQVTTFRAGRRSVFSKDPATDVRNRDFTINALLFDPFSGEIIDLVGGRADIRAGVIRAVGDPDRMFRQDCLRLMRAVRMATTLDFKIEAKTFRAVRENAGRIKKASPERVRDELIRIMTGPAPHRGVNLLDKAGLLKVILPEIEALKGVQQPPQFHPEGDVFVHTMLLLKGLKNADRVLAFAALLHDIGKPATFMITDRIRFHGHEVLGGRMAEKILRRLRFPQDDIRRITQVIANHMRVMHAREMREATLKRFFLQDTAETELALHRLDCRASHGEMTIYRFLRRGYLKFKRTPVLPRPLLNGHGLITIGFKEGPMIGTLQREMVDLQLEGKIRTLTQARAWAKERWIHEQKH
ncbi:MAG: CCA tRNA nucleotidyltransferase [Candidatus Omnitrophota bacterium]